MAKTKGPFRDSHAPSWLSGPRTDAPDEHPSHRPQVVLLDLKILNFEISLSLSPRPQSSLVPPCNISLGVRYFMLV
jgi:hypothetical protein